MEINFFRALVCCKRLHLFLYAYWFILFCFCFFFPAFITMNLYGWKTSVWIGFQSDDYEKQLNENPQLYSNWSPVEVVDVSIFRGLWQWEVGFIHKNHYFHKTGPKLLQQFWLLLTFATPKSCGHRFTGTTRSSKQGTIETDIYIICGSTHIFLQLVLRSKVGIMWLVLIAWPEQSLGTRLWISYFNTVYLNGFYRDFEIILLFRKILFS